MRRILGVALLVVLGFALAQRSLRAGSCTGDGIRGASENSLRQDLFTVREVIEEYRADKKKRPQTLDELVAAGYIKKIPVDPLTHHRDWVLEWTGDANEPGIVNLHSASSAVGCAGTPLNTW